MRKSYLSMGGTSMGIAGSIVEPSFSEAYLGMHVETLDMSEFVRRVDEGICDREEFEQAPAWVRAHCREGKDYNPPHQTRSREQNDQDWVISAKMALIARDLTVGNPRLADDLVCAAHDQSGRIPRRLQ
jgi:L-fucose isomerase